MEFSQIDEGACGPELQARARAGEALLIQEGDHVIAMLVPLDPPLDIAHAAGLLGGIEAARKAMP